jgi:hypothetical protein
LNTKEPGKTSVQKFSSAVIDGDDFLPRITGYETTGVHHYDPLTKSNQWNGIISRRHARTNSRCRLLQVKSWLAFIGRVTESC